MCCLAIDRIEHRRKSHSLGAFLALASSATPAAFLECKSEECFRKRYGLTMHYCIGANGIMWRYTEQNFSTEDGSIFFARSFDENPSFAQHLTLQPLISDLLQELPLLRHQVRQLSLPLVKLSCHYSAVVLVDWTPRAAVNAVCSWSGGHSRWFSLHASRRERSVSLLRFRISMLSSLRLMFEYLQYLQLYWLSQWLPWMYYLRKEDECLQEATRNLRGLVFYQTSSCRTRL